MVEGPQICIQEIDPLVAIIIDPGLLEDGAGVLGGEIARLDADHAHPLGENGKETGNGKGIETEGEIVIETGIGTKIETLTGKEKRTEDVVVTEKLKKEKIGFQHQRRRQ